MSDCGRSGLRERRVRDRPRRSIANEITPNGGLTERHTRAMKMAPSLLAERKLIEAGYNHSVALCMTIAAMHTGRKVTFDDADRGWF